MSDTGIVVPTAAFVKGNSGQCCTIGLDTSIFGEPMPQGIKHYTEAPITYLSLNQGATVGVPDHLISVRVIATGKDANDVLARTVSHDEEILDFGIQLNAGERLVFPANKLRISIHDLEHKNPKDANGYAPIANVVWTWLNLPRGIDVNAAQNQHALYFLESAGRRLDTVYHLWQQSVEIIEGAQKAIKSDSHSQVRVKMFQALGYAELVCLGLHRVVVMVRDTQSHFNISFDARSLCSLESKIAPALMAIRHAIEHIDERTLGNVRQSTHPDAYTIFDQAQFYTSDTITYGSHSLNLRQHILPTIVFCRNKLFQAVVSQAGETRSNNSPIVAFDGKGDDSESSQ